MVSLLAAAVYFVLLHLIVAPRTGVRAALVARIGPRPYTGLFALASLVGVVWLSIAFGAARGDPANAAYWAATPATRYVQLALQLLAFLSVVVGLATPNPTSVHQEGVLARPDAVKGVLRITRHPFLWGVALWALGHLLVNGDGASLLLFGSLLAVALFGTASIDAKRKRAVADQWRAFAAQTSNIPFAAILAGRQTLKLGEIGWWRILLAVAVWAALIVAHPYLFGAPATP